MKIKNQGKKIDNKNYKLFNVVFLETANGIRVLDARGSVSTNDDLIKLNSRGFARAFKTKNLITR